MKYYEKIDVNGLAPAKWNQQLHREEIRIHTPVVDLIMGNPGYDSQTDVQKTIEEKVTNGLGYIPVLRYEGTEATTKGLQFYLGLMDMQTGKISKKEFRTAFGLPGRKE